MCVALSHLVGHGQCDFGQAKAVIGGVEQTVRLDSANLVSSATMVGYTVPSDTATARLKDLSDNPAESFTGQAVTNNTAAAQTPLTASIHDEATSHDGQEEFTFELRFSENLEGFSYKTLRDNAFTVTGGKVEGARRLTPPSNTKWQIKIRPTSNGDVTIVLPITEDCTADGAVCTGDGRKLLSNRLELTVSGPTYQQTSQQRQESTAATGSPTISGTVQVGQTLAASTTGIADTDGLTNASYSYQWIANDGSSDSDIADATANAYTPVDGDAGKTIKVKVAFADDGGNEETLTSAPTAAVAATVPGAPGGLSVSVNDTGKLDVSWSVPPTAMAVRPSPDTRCSGRRPPTVGTRRLTCPRQLWPGPITPWPASPTEWNTPSGCLPSIQRETALPPRMKAGLPGKPRLPPSRPEPWTVQR